MKQLSFLLFGLAIAAFATAGVEKPSIDKVVSEFGINHQDIDQAAEVAIDVTEYVIPNGFNITIYAIGNEETREGYRVVELKPPLDTTFSNLFYIENDSANHLNKLHRDPGRRE